MDVKLIRAFIASPGGLDAERRIAWTAAEEVNRSVARGLGFRLELIGWEETISGVGRPQSLINAELETCDLFIGAMWTKWGSRPSIDGPYTSGFEEEFELSLSRNKATSSPHMAMFFKDIAEQQLADPGEDLRRVLAFKQRLIDGKELLFGRFATPEEFGREVREFLAVHVIARHRQSVAAAEDDKPRHAPDDETNPADTADSLENPKEAAFLAVIERKVRESTESLDAVQVARLRLIAASLGGAGNDDPEIGVHDSNLIYRHRSDLDLSQQEQLQLMRAGLGRIADENVPVWTWVANASSAVSQTLVISSLYGREDAKIGSIIVMTRAGAQMPEDGPFSHTKVVARWFAPEQPTSLRLAALRYLKRWGSVDDLRTINAEIDKGGSADTLAVAIESAAEIHWQRDEEAALRFLLSSSFETLEQTLLDRALVRLETLSSRDLIVGLDHRSPQIRARAVELLSVRGDLSAEMAQRAMEDTSPAVRVAAVRALDRANTPLAISDAHKTITPLSRNVLGGIFGLLPSTYSDPASESAFEDYRRERFAKMPLGQLEALAASSGSDREAAFFVLCERRFPSMADQLRRDIDDGFHNYVAARWPEGVPERRYRGGAASLLSLGQSTPEERKRRDLMNKATEILARRRELADLGRMRTAFDNADIGMSPPIIDYLAALGGWEDIKRIDKVSPMAGLFGVGMSQKGRYETAAKAILRLASGRTADLLATEMQPSLLSAILLEMPASQFIKIARGQLLDLLHHSDANVRRVVAIRGSGLLSKAKIVSILRDYGASERSEYYNVIHWLDLRIALDSDAVRHAVTQTLAP